MTLAEWLETNKMTQDTFGRKIGLTQGRVSQIAASGTQDIETAMRIRRATDFAVTLDELLPKAVRDRLAGDAAAKLAGAA